MTPEVHTFQSLGSLRDGAGHMRVVKMVLMGSGPQWWPAGLGQNLCSVAGTWAASPKLPIQN